MEHGLGHLPFTEMQVVTPTGALKKDDVLFVVNLIFLFIKKYRKGKSWIHLYAVSMVFMSAIFRRILFWNFFISNLCFMRHTENKREMKGEWDGPMWSQVPDYIDFLYVVYGMYIITTSQLGSHKG